VHRAVDKFGKNVPGKKRFDEPDGASLGGFLKAETGREAADLKLLAQFGGDQMFPLGRSFQAKPERTLNRNELGRREGNKPMFAASITSFLLASHPFLG
jgi:hypothetical protein